MFVDSELVGVRASVVTDGDGLPTPDEFCAAEAEMFPPSKRQLSGPAAGCAVPSFHRLDCEAISEMDAAPRECLCERITQFVVAWNLNWELCEERAKALNIPQTAEV